MTKKKLKVCWISAGVSSFMAGYLAKDVDEFIYIDIEDQHSDSMRFIKDCERALGKPIQILRSQYGNKGNVIKTFRYINGVAGAKCTEILKKRPRKEWEQEHKEYEITYVWGFDAGEQKRADRLFETMPEFHHEFPLIDRELSKSDVHGMFDRLFDFPRPKMYDMGYRNNNCIGCVKGGMGYWNKIRVDFPEVFDRMAKLEREIGHTCINGVLLDELDPDRGRIENEIMPDCSTICYLAIHEHEKS